MVVSSGPKRAVIQTERLVPLLLTVVRAIPVPGGVRVARLLMGVVPPVGVIGGIPEGTGGLIPPAVSREVPLARVPPTGRATDVGVVVRTSSSTTTVVLDEVARPPEVTPDESPPVLVPMPPLPSILLLGGESGVLLAPMVAPTRAAPLVPTLGATPPLVHS